MNINIPPLLPRLSNDAKIWIFQSDRIMTDSECDSTLKLLPGFLNKWVYHGIQLKGDASLFFNFFLIFGVEENIQNAGGCSIDELYHFVREIGMTSQINWFDRKNILLLEEKPVLVKLNDLKERIANNKISHTALFFNNLIVQNSQLTDQWLIPVKNSWLTQKLGIS